MTSPTGNPVNRKKLPNSKWTAVSPIDREKHFLVLDWIYDEEGLPTDQVQIEAVLTNVIRQIHWRELEDASRWKIGWR